MNTELQIILTRIVDVAADPDQLGTVILKGHLLIEEQLSHCLEWAVAEPRFVREANLRFHQKLLLARSLEGTDQPAWDMASTINSLRNEMAHNLASPNRAKRIQELRRKLQQLVGQPDVVARAETASDQEVVGFAIGVCLGVFAAWQNDLRSERERR
ncbi:MAG: hypothetical protein SF066_00610 [Thermoanaerobaculia bacterium]|nr:hypothetical protein [Thermoanaerobaculia bacterium]